jgi:predicted alpha/beta superfamily hydrolase
MVQVFIQLTIFFLLSIAAIAIAVQVIKHNLLIWGRTNRIHSKILNTTRRVRVVLPAGYNKSARVKQQYPVIYLFDGDALCKRVIAVLKQLKEETTDGIYPEMIIVAVSNRDRASDLTPTNSLIGPEGNRLDMLKNSGGSEKFIAFIERELMPYIESAYPTSRYKMLMGYSLGGLTVMNILINQTKMFDAYIAIDPSMWWDNRKVLEKAQEQFKNKNFAGTSLFLGIANTMPADMDIEQAKDDITGPTNHIRSILELIAILESNPDNGLNWQHKYYPDKDHDSVTLPGIYDALRFLFDNKAI